MDGVDESSHFACSWAPFACLLHKSDEDHDLNVSSIDKQFSYKACLPTSVAGILELDFNSQQSRYVHLPGQFA